MTQKPRSPSTTAPAESKPSTPASAKLLFQRIKLESNSVDETSEHVGKGYMLDTNAFNKAARNPAISRAIVGRAVFTTHVQKGELASTSDPAVRALLLEAYGAVAAREEPTDTATWNDTPWDASYWSSTDGLYDRLLNRIREADRRKKKKSRYPMNQSRDARVGETAIRQSFALVSDDEGLAAAVRAEGGEAMTVAEFRGIG